MTTSLWLWRTKEQEATQNLMTALSVDFVTFLFFSCAPLPFKRLEFKNHTEPSQVRVQENNATFEIKKKKLNNGININ